LLGARNRHDDAIVQYKRVLEIDPRRYEVLQSIGEQYEAKGDLQQALDSYKKYAGHLPKNSDPFISIGNLYKKMGDNHRAKSHYEKALLIKPDDISVLVNLADIEAKLGHFDNARRQHREALNFSKIPKDKAAVYEGLADLCEMRGQVKQSFEYNQRSLDLSKEFMPPILVSFSILFSIDKYIQAGKEKEAFQTLETLKQDLQPPYDKFVDFGYLKVYLDLGRANEAEKLLPVVEEIVQASGARSYRYFAHLAGGRIHQLRGEYIKAIEDFQKGLEIRPSKTELLLNGNLITRNSIMNWPCFI
jgi:tetratricopeptide (TPR) repeat protein